MAQLNPHTLTGDELQALLAVTAGHPRDHLILSLALGTGLRLGELTGLDVGDLYFPAGQPRIRGRIRPEIVKRHLLLLTYRETARTVGALHPAPIGSSRSDPSPGGTCTHWESAPLQGAQLRHIARRVALYEVARVVPRPRRTGHLVLLPPRFAQLDMRATSV
jgi:integrase